MPLGTIDCRPITADEHLGFIRGRASASFLQTPAWARVKSEWEHESLGWFERDTLVGAGLVLYRKLPKLSRCLAYLPEGPVLDWEGAADRGELAALLQPMVAHLKSRGAFGIRIGPPVITRRWSAAQIKQGIADDDVRRLTEIAPAERSPAGARVVSALHELGWRPQAADGGFAAGQPQYNFVIPLAGRTEADVLAGMNQLWRRNIKKAAKEGVTITSSAGTPSADTAASTSSAGTPSADTAAGTPAAAHADLQAFHTLYVHTAERDGFTPRPLRYFEEMYDALSAEDPGRITVWSAHHDGDLVAATIGIRVGTHAWYSYGASSTEKREVRGSNAIQWAMIRDALAHGCETYDLRGITDTLESGDPHVGLIQFKVGTGGEAVEYAGEWDLPLNRLLYKGFEMYLARRS